MLCCWLYRCRASAQSLCLGAHVHLAPRLGSISINLHDQVRETHADATVSDRRGGAGRFLTARPGT